MANSSARVIRLSLPVAPITLEVCGGLQVVGRVQRPVMALDNTAPCNSGAGCPIGNRIRDVARLVDEREFRAAWDVLKEDNPFPSITGRVCYRPCEDACNRGQFDEPVGFGTAIERFLGDFGLETARIVSVSAKKQKVAVVGSGPAGLSAAYFLTRDGYQVTVFEKLPVAGGMLSAGIPAYRLPRGILEAELNALVQLGVEIRVNCPIGDDPSLADLKRSFDAVLVATGADASRSLNIPGADAGGAIEGISFLREVNLDGTARVGNRVVVIGGGNVAIDAARSCLRLGSKEVTILYRRSRAEMPAHEEEIAAAEAEGVKIEYLASPIEVSTKAKIVTGLRCVRMRLGEPDGLGRRSVEPVEGRGFDVGADMVIAAIGQSADLPFLEKIGLGLNPDGTVRADQRTSSTTVDAVYAAGDAATGPKTVADAIAAGRRAARAIDARLRGEEPAPAQPLRVVTYEMLNTDYFVHSQRASQPVLPVDQRTAGFDEVNLGMGEAAAVREAKRCFSCGLCTNCEVCSTYCPEGIIAQAPRGIEVDLVYCKGCGICVDECPRSAIRMELEG